MTAYYEAILDLRHIYLEDSYVLGIHEADGALLFDLLAVLTESHPAYQVPTDDVQYCYRAARVSFESHLDFRLDRTSISTPARSTPMGVSIYGNIDAFEIMPDWLLSRWRLGSRENTLQYHPFDVARLIYGHFTTGGMDDRIEATLPPVFRPNRVPRSYSRLNST